jgi:hypothetical protein
MEKTSHYDWDYTSREVQNEHSKFKVNSYNSTVANSKYLAEYGYYKFLDGLVVGGAIGMYPSILSRRIRPIFSYALGLGAFWSTVNVASAYFRNEL